ncbi:MAG TPA: PIN domain-containing protein [Vicinamibacterales bacterium]|nr:PIN domain-containing protein [Vicinamibacterales bacterium]
MLVALDTNVLLYAAGLDGEAMQRRALAIVDRLVPESTLVPVQVLGELYAALMRKGGRSRTQARDAVLRWGDTFPVIETSSSVQLMAMELSVNHQLAPWDAVILSAAADANCRLLLSEDLQDGFTWSGVTVANPFSAKRHALLDAMLSSDKDDVRRRTR